MTFDATAAERDRLKAMGAPGALLGKLARLRGRFWFVSLAEDAGLVCDVTEQLGARIAKLKPDAFFDAPNLATYIDAPRPPHAVIVPVTCERRNGMAEPCTRLGSIWVQRRFIDAVRDLGGYRGARWFAPDDPLEAPVHAVVGDRVVALIGGVITTPVSLAHNDQAVEA